MVSIAYALKHGLGFLGSMSDVNKLGPKVWSRRWKGNGPDYLFINFEGQFTFLEIKGCSSWFPTTNSPPFIQTDVASGAA